MDKVNLMEKDILSYLTNPYITGSDSKIHHIYLELFKGLQPNSTVRTAFYMWHVNAKNIDSSPADIGNEILSKVSALSVDALLLFDKDFMKKSVFETLGDLATEKCARWAGGLPDSITYRPSSDRYYLFKGEQYIRHLHGGPLEKNYPKQVDDVWSGWPNEWLYGHVDAVAYYEPSDRYYLFKGKEFARHPHNYAIDAGYPKSVKGSWSGWPSSWGSGNVDAVVYYPPNKRWYLFKGDEYVRHRHGKGPDSGYPKKIVESWSGWPETWGNGRVDGVVWHPETPSTGFFGGNGSSNDGKFYLMKGNEYVRHAFGSTPDTGYPKSITSVWSGWPSLSMSNARMAYEGVPDKAQGLCWKGTPKMHNKTLLFSELQFDNPPTFDGKTWPSTMKYVVVESSANIWQSQYHQANQLILTYGHREIYEDALRRFKNILHRKRGAKKFPAYSPKDTRFTLFKTNDIKVYGFPRGSDLIVAILKNIGKAIAQAGSDEVAKIRMIMADFTRIEVAEEMTTLKANHQDLIEIRLVARDTLNESEEDEDDDVPVKEELLNGLTDEEGNSIRVKIDSLAIDPNPDNDKIRIHSKAIIYEGPYRLNGETQWCKLVWCGAHNLTYSALKRNSETLWRIWNDDVFETFVENFNALEAAILP